MAKKKRVDLFGDDVTVQDSPFVVLSRLRAELPAGPAQADAAESETPDGSAKRVTLRRQKKGHGGKTVTRLEGLAPNRDTELRIKNELGTGARWDGDALVVQGDQRERLRTLLESDGFRVTIGS
ncbi:MAG: translation initiation factor [Myxococcota bacterium]